MSQGPSQYPQRNPYGSSSKLPDRTALGGNHNPQTLGQSTFLRRPDQPYQYSQGPPAANNGPSTIGGRQGMEKESNALNDLSEEQREEINEAFSLFDLDRDRHLDYHELRVALRALGFQIPKQELVQMLQTQGVPKPSHARQSAGRGTRDQPTYHPSQMLISQNAFSRVAAQRVLERDPREEVERAFNLFDFDQKGYITLDDLRRVSRDLGETGLEEDEMRAMIDEFDYDGSGGVSREAFFTICLQ